MAQGRPRRKRLPERRRSPFADLPDGDVVWLAPPPNLAKALSDAEILEQQMKGVPHSGRSFTRAAAFPQHGIVVKWSRSRAEAETLWYLSKHTDIPVPRLYGWRERLDSGGCFVFMEHINGPTLSERWSALDQDDRDEICRQLRAIYRKLRAVPHPRPDWRVCEPLASSHSAGATLNRRVRLARRRPSAV